MLNCLELKTVENRKHVEFPNCLLESHLFWSYPSSINHPSNGKMGARLPWRAPRITEISPCQDPIGSAVHPYLEGTAALPGTTPEVLAAVVPPRPKGLAKVAIKKELKHTLAQTFAILKTLVFVFWIAILSNMDRSNREDDMQISHFSWYKQRRKRKWHAQLVNGPVMK